MVEFTSDRSILMKCYARISLILPILLLHLAAFGQLGSIPSEDSAKIIAKWVDVTNLISIQLSEWREGRALLTYNIDLLKTEISGLEDQISQSEEQAREAERRTDLLRDEESTLRAAAAIVENKVREYEDRIQNQRPIYPPPLRDRIIQFVSRLPSKQGESVLTLEERLATILNILEEVDKFNNSVTVVSELKEVSSGERIEVKTMYLGLAQAFYVDRNIQYAAAGVPKPNGWDWTPQPKLAKSISRSIQMYNNAIKPAQFILLPVTID